MKKNQREELKSKTVAELQKYVTELGAEIAKLRIDMSIGKEKNTSKVKEMKKNRARALTAMQAKKGEVVNG